MCFYFDFLLFFFSTTVIPWDFVAKKFPRISGECLAPVLESWMDGMCLTSAWWFLGVVSLKGRRGSSSAAFLTYCSWFWSLCTCCLRSSTLLATFLAILRLCWTFFMDAPIFCCFTASLVRAWWVSSNFLISSFFKSILACFLWLSANFSSSSLSAGCWSFSTLSIGVAFFLGAAVFS